MASEFVDLKQAAKMLGLTPDALIEMRSQGEIYGYRDGSSWKFKQQEIERVAEERGITLGAADGDSSVADFLASDLEDLDPDSDADSLLVTPDVLSNPGGGEASSSTIIGKQTGDPSAESDLKLVSDSASDDVLDEPPSLTGSGGSSILTDELASGPGASDVKLVANGDNESEVKLVADSSDDLLVDNSGELSPSSGDVQLSPASGTGELNLTPGSGTGELEIDSDLALDSSDVEGLDELSLSDGDEDDLVLDGSGSDVTLGAGDTGINLTSASDSGLSLDEDPIELSGSISSLELPMRRRATSSAWMTPPTRTKPRSSSKTKNSCCPPPAMRRKTTTAARR